MARAGFVRDLVVIPVILSGIILGLFFCAFLWDEFSDIITPMALSDAPVDQVFTDVSAVWSWVDYLLILVLVGSMIGVWFLVSRLPSNPLFFWLSLIPVFLTIFLSFIPSNILNNFFTDVTFADELARFPISVWIGRNFPLIVLVTAVISSIILYSNSNKPMISNGGIY